MEAGEVTRPTGAVERPDHQFIHIPTLSMSSSLSSATAVFPSMAAAAGGPRAEDHSKEKYQGEGERVEQDGDPPGL
jgi:hypothetical protein